MASVNGSRLQFSCRNETLIFSATSVWPVLSCKSRANLRFSSSCTFRSLWESLCNSAVRSKITDSSWAWESASCLECFEIVHISPPGSGGGHERFSRSEFLDCAIERFRNLVKSAHARRDEDAEPDRWLYLRKAPMRR